MKKRKKKIGHSVRHRVVFERKLSLVMMLLMVMCSAAVVAGPDLKADSLLLKKNSKGLYISPYDFNDTGDWVISGFESASQLAALTGPFHRETAGLKPAEVVIGVEQAGEYALWVKSLDFAQNQPGARFFYVESNGKVLEKRLGNHGHNGFRWELADRVYLEKGENRIRLVDSSAFYPRCDGIFLTSELKQSPEEITAVVETYGIKHFVAKPLLNPPRPSKDAEVTQVFTLTNERMAISFHQVVDGEDQRVETAVVVDGVMLKKRSDDNGLILLKAAESQFFYDKGFPIFRSEILDESGQYQVAVSNNPYESFDKAWLLPKFVEQTSEGAIKMIYQSEEVEVESSWTLVKGAREPVVRLTLRAKKPGIYSVIVPSTQEFEDEEYAFALAPMRVTNKRVHPSPLVYTEQYLFTPMVAVSLSDENMFTKNSSVTLGFTVDPSAIQHKWTYNWNNSFGALLRGVSGKVAPALIAPLPGTDLSRFDAGDVYEFTYRPIYHLGGWFDTYKRISTDVFKLKDYRQNYYSSLNEAIFNTTNLMMDDYYGGWDPIGKAHWNMEGRSFSSNANPMQALQSYLLTSDMEILSKRAIPTLANLLTRGQLHFKSDTLFGGANYFGGKATFPRPIGDPIVGYNAPVFQGLYNMSGKRMPILLDIAQKKSRAPVVNSYGNIPPFVNQLARFKLTGDSLLLDTAVTQALEYVNRQVYSTSKEPIDYSAFSYISYIPNIASLIDIYEVTEDKRFLEAAEEAGRILLTQLWVSNPVGDEMPDSLMIKADELRAQSFNEGHDFFWHGEEVWRLGSRPGVKGPPENLNRLQDEQVPAWLPSRVGLGLEQPSTFFNESLNMIMSSWAGDLMKLSEYTGEDLFSIAARNAIIGRFGNYPGYYQNRFMTFQQKPDYPYIGPDFSSIYWHHIPPFLAMMEDFLFAQAWAWSDRQVSFPSLRQQGYAYFNSNQYGHQPGSFFGIEEMWPWLDKEILSVDNLQIDWLAARKDKVLGVALMNESEARVETTITLGPKAGIGYTGPAELYNADGHQETVYIDNGRLNVTLSGHTLIGLSIPTETVRKPAFADQEVNSVDLENTVADHGNGKGIVLQVSPDRYFGYIYVQQKPEELRKLTIDYQVGNGEKRRLTTQTYPFEFIIEVEEPNESLKYELTLEKKDGTLVKKQEYLLHPKSISNELNQ